MKNADMNPHSDVFLFNVLREFEKRLLADDYARKQTFAHVLSHVRNAGGKIVLSGLNLYNPDPQTFRVLEAVYGCGGPYWLIPATIYKAVISRDLARRQGRISRGVSTRTLEDCVRRIMHNVGVLLVNEDMMEGDLADSVYDFNAMFPAIRAALCAKATKDVAAEICKDGEFSQSVGFAFWWYYMASSSFVGPDDKDFPVSNTDMDSTWKKMQNILNSLPANPDEDQFIVFINKFIDLCHDRGSLAGAFVEGGAKTCSEVSNMAPDELYEHEQIAAWGDFLDFA